MASQSTSPGWTLRKWCDYFHLEPSAREKICNVISLEISGTKLSDMILPPRLVRELDWVENYWPSTRKGKGHAYPKVQLYCLMGVATAWTVGGSVDAIIQSASDIRRTGTSILLARLFTTISCAAPRFDHILPSFPYIHDGRSPDLLLHPTNDGESSCI